MLVGCRWVSVAPANVSGKDTDCRSRAGPGHPAGARTIVGRSNLGASPEAIKAVPRLRGAHERLMAPRLPRTYGAPWVGAVSRCYAHLRRAHPGLFPPDRNAVVHAPAERMGVSAPSCAGRMGVLPSQPRSGDAMIAPHRARQRAKVWGMWNCRFWASKRSVNSNPTRANLAYCTTSSRPGT